MAERSLPFTRGSCHAKLTHYPSSGNVPPRQWVSYYVRLFHLASAAFLAICFLFRAESFAARAGPPFRPPFRPSATAAGSFSDSWGSGFASPVASPTMAAASEFTSRGRLRERSGIDDDAITEEEGDGTMAYKVFLPAGDGLAQLKNNGVTITIRDQQDRPVGRLRVGRATVEWAPKDRKMGDPNTHKRGWASLIQLLESGS